MCINPALFVIINQPTFLFQFLHSEYFPFHSTASTGSGSSSSVVTVIAADDPNNTFGRRRVQRHPDGAADDPNGTGSRRPGPGAGAGGGGGGGGGFPAGQK